MSNRPSLLAIQISLAAWKKIPGLQTHLQKAARATADDLPKKFHFSFTVNLLLTGDAKIKQLNHDFRGINKATNVLSFPQFEPADLPSLGKQKTPVELGDIALAYQYIAEEAKADHKILKNHITHLVIHGLLHLFGYDHLMTQDATVMEKRERKIMRSLGLPDPYALPAVKNRP